MVIKVDCIYLILQVNFCIKYNKFCYFIKYIVYSIFEVG